MPRKKVAQEAEPTPVSIPVDVWAQEAITRLYLAKYGQVDVPRITELTNLYIRILRADGVTEVRPAIEDAPVVEKPKRKGGRPKRVVA